MKPPASGRPSAQGVSGGVELRCGSDATGRPVIKSQRFSPPVHFGKAYHDPETNSLLLNLSCPTAGLLEGDEMTCDVTVEKGGSLVLTTPGATRAHVMRSGFAKVRQRFVVEDGGFLEFAPEVLILQRDSRLVQDTHVEVTPQGELLYLEFIAPGRVARGELFQFEEFTNRFLVTSQGKPLAREYYSLRPDDSSVGPWKNAFPEPVYAAFYCFSPKLTNALPCRENLHELASEDLLVGATRLHRNGWTVKLLAADLITLRKAISISRSYLYATLNRAAPSFRRY